MTTETIPAGTTVPADQAAVGTLREQGRLERLFGPEWARVLRGLFINRLSIVGLSIVVFFILVAALAPTLAPKVRPNADPYLIPRDGFGPEPKPPGTLWERTPARPWLVPRPHR